MSNTLFKNYPNILISLSRIITLSTFLIIGGIFFGFICIWYLTSFKESNLIGILLSIVFLIGSIYSIYSGIRCMFISRIQFQFTNTGIMYKKVAEPFDEYKQNIGLRFYFTKEFCFLDYKNILEAGITKRWGGHIIYVLCKPSNKVYIPISFDYLKDSEELVRLINENLKQENYR